ncbi:MAG: ABC transporter ATP-binding protein [Candidatus Anammoxibacter sp.]
MLLEVKNLKKIYPNKRNTFLKQTGYTHAVNGVSFSLDKGKTLGLVGESGSGKTTTGKLVLRLIEATEGEVYFNGIPIMGLSKKEMIAKRKDMQIIFQDPYGSMNPKMTIANIIGEPFEIHKNMSKKERRNASAELLNRVGLSDRYLDHYPHEFSGGQKQRICIARAIALKPQFIVCDEAVSSLDVSTRAQIIELLIELQTSFGISYLFITHDLNTAKHICDHIAVMFNGKIVEKAKAKNLFDNPSHPYSKSLLAAIPVPDPFIKRERNCTTFDNIADNPEDKKGCSFYNRCTEAINICNKEAPELIEVANDHFVSCHKAAKPQPIQIP